MRRAIPFRGSSPGRRVWGRDVETWIKSTGILGADASELWRVCINKETAWPSSLMAAGTKTNGCGTHTCGWLRFYVFLHEIRAELFDEAFQAELAAIYQPRGTAPVPPALLAMVMLLQAYDQVGDAEAVVTARVDQHWAGL